MPKNRRRLILGWGMICLVAVGVVWQFRQPPQPDNCSIYQRPDAPDEVLLCQESSDTDNYLSFYVREGKAKNIPLTYLGEVSASDKNSYFAGCFWSKDGSLFIVTKIAEDPDSLLEGRKFEAGYDFLKGQRVQISQYETLLRKRGGPSTILDLKQ